MDQRLTIQRGGPWVNPFFAAWGRAWAAVMTQWLYTDPSYPLRLKPDEWPTGGLVRVSDRVLSTTALANAANTTITMDFFGGRQYILASRRIVARTSAGLSLETDAIDVEEKARDGTPFISDGPASANFGTGEMPFLLNPPQLMVGNERHDVKITNSTGSTANVYLYWSVFWLDTGR